MHEESKIVRVALVGLGWACVGLGLAGVFLPLLPTTPFVLVAVWAFARSSPRLARWIEHHPRLGAYVRDWRSERAIPLRAKVLALAMMAASLTWLVLATATPGWLKGAVAVTLAAVAVYIVTRPLPGRSSHD